MGDRSQRMKGKAQELKGKATSTAGYETRKHLYNLYHLLNHLNIFGRGYLSQVEATLRILRRAT